MCNLLDVFVKKISNIRQADQVKTADKLQYISVTNSKLKLRVMRNGTKDWVLPARKMQGGKRCPKTIVIARFDLSQLTLSLSSATLSNTSSIFSIKNSFVKSSAIVLAKSLYKRLINLRFKLGIVIGEIPPTPVASYK